MSSKKFNRSVFLMIVLLISAVGVFNFLVNPFGVFKEGLMHWDAYNMTQNPRTAKINYLKSNSENYTSYIIGSSGASAFPVDTLNAYTGQSYYNLFYYGADMYDTLNTVNYILDHNKVEELLLPISFSSAFGYHSQDDDLYYTMDPKVEKSSYIKFYMRYLMANPKIAMEKIQASQEDSYFQKSFDVFKPLDGSYDKSLRDVEYIGNQEDYLTNFSVFQDHYYYPKVLDDMTDTMQAIQEIKNRCDAEGVTLRVVMYPLLKEELYSYDEQAINLFYEHLTSITSFWDFTYSDISDDYRYFYDPGHFRNDIGRMMISKIFDDPSGFIPDNFGVYVGQGEKRDFNQILREKDLSLDQEATKNIPILIMHHIAEEVGSSSVITKEKFEEVTSYIKENGYETIGYSDLEAYVNGQGDLPNKPIMITFDDGYKSNYEIAYPILKANNQKALIFVIGSSVGKSTYKATDLPIIEHFSVAEAAEMMDSGLIEIGSHSFDLHQSAELEIEQEAVYPSMLPIAGQSEVAYINRIKKDLSLFDELYSEMTTASLKILAFPLGEYNRELTYLLKEAGISATFTTEEGSNVVMKGMPQTLLNLRRHNIAMYTDFPALFEQFDQD